jgi:hypothetical protein
MALINLSIAWRSFWIFLRQNPMQQTINGITQFVFS